MTRTARWRRAKAGEILVKSQANMSAYWRDPEETAQTLKDGWLYTGDLARMDEDGYYWFVGCKKNIIIRGGSNIAPGVEGKWRRWQLAIFDNYRLTRKNASFDLDNKILPNPLGERIEGSDLEILMDDIFDFYRRLS